MKKMGFLQFCLIWEMWGKGLHSDVYTLIIRIWRVAETYLLSNTKFRFRGVLLNHKLWLNTWKTILINFWGTDRWLQSIELTFHFWKTTVEHAGEENNLSLLTLSVWSDPFMCHFLLLKLVFLVLFVLLTVLALCQKALFRGWFYLSKMGLHMLCSVLSDWENFVAVHITIELLLPSRNPCRCMSSVKLIWGAGTKLAGDWPRAATWAPTGASLTVTNSLGSCLCLLAVSSGVHYLLSAANKNKAALWFYMWELVEIYSEIRNQLACSNEQQFCLWHCIPALVKAPGIYCRL